MEVNILIDAWRQRSLRTRIGIFSGSVAALLHVAIIALMIVSAPEIAVVWDWYTHLIFGRGPRQLLFGTFAPGIVGGVLASGLFNLRRESINGQSPRLWILVLLLGTVGGLLVIATLLAALIVFVLFVADMTVHSGFAGGNQRSRVGPCYRGSLRNHHNRCIREYFRSEFSLDRRWMGKWRNDLENNLSVENHIELELFDETHILVLSF